MSDDLIQELRDHSCGCGGPCGQQTPAYIALAAATLAAKDAALSEMRAELEQVKNERDYTKDLLTEEFRVSNDFATKLIAARAQLERARKALEDAEAVVAYAAKAERLTRAALKMLENDASAFLAALDAARTLASQDDGEER